MRPLFHFKGRPSKMRTTLLLFEFFFSLYITYIIYHIIYSHSILITYIQLNLSYVTFHGISEIWSHKTGGRLIMVLL